MLKLAAFDFDGTLADSVDFCLKLFEVVLNKYMGDKAPSREDIYQNFGMNEPGVLRHFFGRSIPEAEADFFKLHRQLHMQWCPAPFPGALEMLDSLRQMGVKLALVTGRDKISCDISLEVLNMEHYFETVKNGSPERIDKAAQLRQLMEQYGLKADELVYIGDAVSDAVASCEAGVTCLSAAWASSARIAELEKVNPGLVFTSIGSMLDKLTELAK